MKQLGDRLSELREDRNLKQTDLAKMLHSSNSSISAYETGNRVPSIETVVELSQIFDVTTDYLLGLSQSDISPSILAEDFIGGVTVGAVIEMLSALQPDQKSAIMVILRNMHFYADVKDRTDLNGAQQK